VRGGRLAAVAALGALSPWLLAACSGGGGTKATVPDIGSAEAQRDREQDGAALLTSTIIVRFDRSYRLAKSDIPLASHFELAVPTGADAGSKTERVLVREAKQSPEDSRAIILSVDRLIADGATVRVARKLFRAGETGELEAEVDSDLAPLQALFASRAFGFTDESMLNGQLDPPATAADRDEATQREALEAHLVRRQAPQELIDTALDMFDALPVETIPSPKLRAAIAALVGTFAQDAIESLVTDQNCTNRPAAGVLFRQPPDAPGLFAQVTHEPDGRRVINVNPGLEGERLERLMAIIAHESIHCDPDASLTEEVVATAFDTLMYLMLLATNPEIARDSTRLSREYNVDAVAMINSGRAFPESIGLLKSPGVDQALPSTNSAFASFADLVAAAYAGVPGVSPEEPLARAYSRLLAGAVGMEDGSAWDVRYIDEVLGRSLDPRLMVLAVEALSLAVVPK
jgi:hypothetical protein